MILLSVRIKPDGVLGLKVKIWGHLFTEVVRVDKCSFCGACIGVCPVKAIDEKDEKPAIVSRCVGCGFCYAQCPHTSFNVQNVIPRIFNTNIKHDVLGYFSKIYFAKSTDKEVLKYAQDGGVASTILLYSLDSGFVDCVILSGLDVYEPFKPKPLTAFNRENVLKGAGSRYTASPNLIALCKAVDEFDVKSIGFVGVGCHITALRKMQYHDYGALKYGLKVKFSLGLFCSKTFYYSSLFKNFLTSKGIDLNKITRTEISKGKFIVKSGNETLFSITIKEIENYGRKSCDYCGDFTAELADISLGSLDAPDNWTTVIIRTEIGEKLFMDCINKGLLEFREIDVDKLKSTIKIAMGKKKRVTELTMGSSTS